MFIMFNDETNKLFHIMLIELNCYRSGPVNPAPAVIQAIK